MIEYDTGFLYEYEIACLLSRILLFESYNSNED